MSATTILVGEPYATTLTDTEKMIRRHEGYRKFPYQDTLGKETVGIGYCLANGMPEDEAVFLMRYRTWQNHKALMSVGKGYPKLSPERQAALLNMAYQLGLAGLLGFKNMWDALAGGDYRQASQHALSSLWARQTPGRAKEIASVIETGKIPAELTTL